MSLDLRSARPDDALAVARVHVRSWQAAYRGLLPDGYLDALRPEDRAPYYDFAPTEPLAPSTIVAVEGDRILGFATTGVSTPTATPHAGELMALYVDPDAWGRGIGRQLIAEARSRLRTLAFTDAVLWVLVGNVRAQRFYERDGWAADGQVRSQRVWGLAVDEIRYRSSLFA